MAAPSVLLTRPNASVEFEPQKLKGFVLSLHPPAAITYTGYSSNPDDVFCIDAKIAGLGEIGVQAFMEHRAEPYRPATMKNSAHVYVACAPEMVPIGEVDEYIWDKIWSDKAKAFGAKYGAGYQFTAEVKTFLELKNTLEGLVALMAEHHGAAIRYNAGAEAERQKYIDEAVRERHIRKVLGD